MLTTILMIIAAAIVLVIILALRQPDEFRVERSTTLPYPPAVVFPHVNNLHKWDAWSPWAKLDPNAKNTFEGPTEGNGACMRWAGNNKVGEGSMTIIDSQLNERIRFRLEFLKPMQATNTAEFTFTPEGNDTKVTWSMYGPNNFIGKVMGVFMNCEKMVGSQFEQGFTNLKDVLGTAKN